MIKVFVKLTKDRDGIRADNWVYQAYPVNSTEYIILVDNPQHTDIGWKLSGNLGPSGRKLKEFAPEDHNKRAWYVNRDALKVVSAIKLSEIY